MMTPRFLCVAAAAALLAPWSSAQTAWPNVNLPTTFQPAGAGFAEDFETAAGVVPTYMAVTEISVATGLADPDAWANIGQRAACGAPNGGSYSLEMGLKPGNTNYHDVQNALVIGLDGQGQTQFYLDFAGHNGGEEIDTFDGVWVSDDGVNWYNVFNPWSPTVGTGNVWKNIVALDLTAAGANLSGTFYLMFAQEDNFPFVPAGTGASDGIGIDDIAVTLTPTPPPPFTWSFVTLPTTFKPIAGLFEDFEAAAGVLQPYMAETGVDASTLLPDPNAWANIGQHNGGIFMGTPYGGSYYLELSHAAPPALAYQTREALVLGLDGTGETDFRLNFQAIENFDETHDFDGIFVSDNGTDWRRLYTGQQTTSNVWVEENGIAMDGTPANVSGQFYLMFSQEDNSAWSGGDGIGYDDISVGPVPTVITLSGNCGYIPSSIDMTKATPNGQVVLAWGFGPGSATVLGGPACVGTVTGLDSIHIAGIGVADANGEYSFTGQYGTIPANACGTVSVQAADVTTCLVSNVISL